MVFYLDFGCLDLLCFLFQRNLKSHCYRLEDYSALELFGWMFEAMVGWMEVFDGKKEGFVAR